MIVTNVLIIVENVIIDESELDYHLQRLDSDILNTIFSRLFLFEEKRQGYIKSCLIFLAI